MVDRREAKQFSNIINIIFGGIDGLPNLSLLNWTMKLEYKQEQHVRKSLVIYATQLIGGLLLKKLKHFEVMLNTF